jgi:MinD superfamily P-loop ATPase
VGETVSAHVGKSHAVVVEQRQAHAPHAAHVIVDGSPGVGCLDAGEVKALQDIGIRTRGRNFST